jgi:hypothetical protein
MYGKRDKSNKREEEKGRQEKKIKITGREENFSTEKKMFFYGEKKNMYGEKNIYVRRKIINKQNQI